MFIKCVDTTETVEGVIKFLIPMAIAPSVMMSSGNWVAALPSMVIVEKDGKEIHMTSGPLDRWKEGETVRVIYKVTQVTILDRWSFTLRGVTGVEKVAA